MIQDRVFVKIDTSARGWRGLSKGMNPSDFDPVQLRKGTVVEMEHVRNRSVAKRIAMDHLVEDPLYYRKLAKFHLSKSRSKNQRSWWNPSTWGKDSEPEHTVFIHSREEFDQELVKYLWNVVDSSKKYSYYREIINSPRFKKLIDSAYNEYSLNPKGIQKFEKSVWAIGHEITMPIMKISYGIR